MDTRQGRAGTRFGPYELRTLIGRGGMGEVYRAYDIRKDREIALKLLPTDLASDDQYRARFQREARMAARLQEPHIIPIHDYGELNGVLFIDMRLVDGKDLRSMLQRGSLMRPDAVVHIITQLADALDAAHRDGLVHRDVKPENVLLLQSGFIYLADFGIAARTDEDRITSGGEALGSFSYMAPERFGDEPAGPAVDIYSLGCLMYELLGSQPPFRRGSVSALIHAHLNERPEPLSRLRPGLPSALDKVLDRALAKNPHDRQVSAGEFARQARQALHSGGANAARPARPVATTPAPRQQSTQQNQARQPSARPHSAHPTAGPSFVQHDTSEPRRQRPLLMGVVSAVAVAVLGVGGYLTIDHLMHKGDPATGSSPIGGPSGSTGDQTGSTGDQTGSTGDQTGSGNETTASPTTGRGSWPAILGDSSAGYDWQGWTAYGEVRCHDDDRAVTVAKTSKSYVTICQTHAGSYYYLGVRPSQTTQPNSIELPAARRTSTGWTVTNTKVSVDYDVSPDGLVITDNVNGTTDRSAITRYVGLPAQ